MYRRIVTAAIAALAVGTLVSSCSSGPATTPPSASSGQAAQTTSSQSAGGSGSAHGTTGAESSSAPPASTADANLVTGGTVNFALGGDPGSLDPWASLNSTNLSLALFAYDTLVSQTTDGKLLPQLATSWQYQSNTWTFSIKKGVTCANGMPMTPSLIASNITFAADPANKVPVAGYLLPPKTTATGDDAAGTLKVTLGSASPFFVQGLYAFPIICSKDLANRNGLKRATEGSGPYTLTQAVANDHYTYTVRPGYTWGPNGASTDAAGTPKTVVFKVVGNETTAANLLLSHQINIATVAGPDRARLQGAGLFHTNLLAPTGEFFFNQRPGHPTADLKVRTALIQAVDFDQLNKVFSGGFGVKPQQLQVLAVTCPTNSVAKNVPPYDVNAAKALLDQAGWTMGPNGVRVKDGKQLSLILAYDSGSPQKQSAAELAIQQWKAVGVKVTGKATDVIGAAQFGTEAWDISWQGYGTFNPAQLIPFFSGPTPPNGNNFSDVNNPAYDKLAAEAMKVPAQQGCSLWNQAEDALIKGMDIVPFSFSTLPTWGYGVTFVQVGGQIIATSLRQTKG